MRKLGFLLTAAVFSFSSVYSAVQAQGQAGGGRLGGEAMGGAALLFRKPANPTVRQTPQSSSSSTGKGKTSSAAKGRTSAKAAAHERVIAKGNAARSAPTPRYSEAEQQYKLAAAEDPDDARAHAGLGNIYLDQSRYQDAVAAYRQALKVKPDYIAAYQPLAYSLARLDRYSESIETLQAALQYEPDNSEIHNNLAFAFVHAGQYSPAIASAQKAIGLLGQTGEAYKQELQLRNEVLSNAYKNLGNAYNGLKQYNQAADALKHAAEIEPKNAAAHFNLGLALYNGGRYSEAIEAYQSVVKLRPGLAGAHYNLAITFLAINDKNGVQREYDVLKTLNPAMAAQLQTFIKK